MRHLYVHEGVEAAVHLPFPPIVNIASEVYSRLRVLTMQVQSCPVVCLTCLLEQNALFPAGANASVSLRKRL